MNAASTTAYKTVTAVVGLGRVHEELSHGLRQNDLLVALVELEDASMSLIWLEITASQEAGSVQGLLEPPCT